jgi:proline utilization trans-activator
MTYERLFHTSMPVTGLLFDATAYDLKWNGERNASFQGPTLPSQSLATHLINTFKFHCGDLFHLFEEQEFMKRFYRFYEDPEGRSGASTLWYIHYLLILAFGQALVSQASRVQRPAGSDLFLHAMRPMLDFAFFDVDPIESIQVLACAVLYL